MDVQSSTKPKEDGCFGTAKPLTLDQLEDVRYAIENPLPKDTIRVWEQSAESIALAAVMALNLDTSNYPRAVCYI